MTTAMAFAAQAPAPVIPPESHMGAGGPGVQRILLNPMEQGGVLWKGAWKIESSAAEPYEGLEAKAGAVALQFKGEAKSGGAKGDFALCQSPAGEIEWLGAWVYLDERSNVAEVGFQVVDAEGEALFSKVPADWTGWKWVEVNLPQGDIKQAYRQEGKNQKVDFPLKTISFIWFTREGGPTSLGIDALAASSRGPQAAVPYSIQFISPAWGEPGRPFGGQLLVNNFTGKPLAVDVGFSVQRNPGLQEIRPVDPVLGGDHAQGCPSWIELDGKRIDNNSLTDDDEYTSYESSFDKGKYTEASQFVDLGRARLITGLVYRAGDANFIRKVDIAGSQDGVTYQPAEGLQGLDFQKKWGRQILSVPVPFKARFLRLHYHNDGTPMDAIRLPAALYVYDGVADESMEIPKTGALIEEKKTKAVVEPGSFALVPLAGDIPLTGDGYLAGVKAAVGTEARTLASNYFVMPSTEVTLRPESHFGMNVSVPGLIPMLKRLGVGWVRFENLKWMFYNPAPGDFRFDGTVAPWNVPFDRYMQSYRDAGFSILPFVFQTPVWATSSPVEKNRNNYRPKNDADYGEALFQLAARYSDAKVPAARLKTPDAKTGLGLIRTYEIWNEPNLNAPTWGFFVGPLSDYFELFRTGAEAVKEADPKAKICNGGIAGLSMDVIDQLKSYKYSDGKSPLDFTDILSVHFYSGRQEPELATEDPNAFRNGARPEQLQTYEKDLAAIAGWRDDLKPSMPIWITETGNDVGGPMGSSERIQAAKLPRCMMIALAGGVEKVFLYREKGSVPAQHAGAGLLRDDETVRPSFFTVATLIRQLDGIADCRTPRLRVSGSEAWMYRWKRGGEDLLVAWTPKGTARLGLALGRCKVTNAFGGESEVEVGSDFELGIFPVYITRISNPAPLEALAKEAALCAEKEQKLLAFEKKSRAYLFHFGASQSLASKTVGLPRPFTPVPCAEGYSEAKGYGFENPVKGKDESIPWAKTNLDKAALRLQEGNRFKIKAEPGRYRFEFKGAGFADASSLAITGCGEGAVTLPLTKETAVVGATVTVLPGKTVEIQLPGCKAQWATLVELAPEKP